MWRIGVASILTWIGRIILSPPPLDELVSQFTAKLVEKRLADDAYAILTPQSLNACYLAKRGSGLVVVRMKPEPILATSPLYVEDVSKESTYLPLVRASNGSSSALLFNLTAKELPIGLVVMERFAPSAFCEKEIAALDKLSKALSEACYFSIVKCSRNGQAR